PSEERMESGLYSRTYLQNQMAVALGGRVAEEIVYGEDEVTTGASNDLQQVASVARQMVTRFGMSDKLGPVALGRAQGGMFLGRDIAAERDFSEDTAATIDSEVSDLVDVAYHRATKVLNDNRSVLDELAEMLVESETVDSQELQDLLIRRDVRIAEYV
ncbi:MAG: cell division protein FtsH, partial [Synechococcales cyanobacterium H12SWP_bin.12]|nr:cell division protein FtsH [Synechococcales cyanobacterium H12SWP_bin.12]